MAAWKRSVLGVGWPVKACRERWNFSGWGGSGKWLKVVWSVCKGRIDVGIGGVGWSR